MSEFFNILRKTLNILAFIGFFGVLLGVAYLEYHLPPIDMLRDVQLQVPLKIFTADKKLIAEYGDKRRTPLERYQVPETLITAILATEDRRFYQHPGVDIRGILRAVHSLITRGTKDQGGSTITMQVARNFFLSRKKTYVRKMNEILLALKIEQELSKDQILELYLNKIYLGKRAYGVAAAAEVYYGKSVSDLTLAQMAMIAGLPQAPSAINPLNSPQAAMKRRKHVLDRMLASQAIDLDAYEAAIQAPLSAQYHGRRIEIHAPFVAERARQMVIDRYGNEGYHLGLAVATTLDSKQQLAARKAVSRGLLQYDKRHGYRGLKQPHPPLDVKDLSTWPQTLQTYRSVHQLEPAAVVSHLADKTDVLTQQGTFVRLLPTKPTWRKAIDLKPGQVVYIEPKARGWVLSQRPEVEGALVALRPTDGAITAMVGGFDFEQSSFNRATQAERQPGSSFKPFIYGAALDNGFTTASIINDAPVVEADPIAEADWRPQNHNHKFYGPTRLRVGITHSRNLVSIRLLKRVGIDKAIDFITRCGLNANTLPKSLSLALGTNQVTPLELARAYSVFANGGYLIEPYLIDKITDYQGNTLHQTTPLQAAGPEVPESLIAPQNIKPQTAYLVTSLLQDVILSGTGRKALELGRRDLAGKTGTTNNWMDAWYAGFNGDVVATTWVGFDEPRSLKEYAVKAALPMWMSFMKAVLAGQPESSPKQPPGLTTVRIDPTTGLLARAGQVDGIYEIFTDDSVPTEVAPVNQNAAMQHAEEQASNESLF